MLNGLEIGGIFFLYLIWIGLLIFFNLRKWRESDFSIMGWIMTNYVQVVSLCLYFHFTFPTELTDSFTPITYFGQTSSVYVSYDCFLKQTWLNFFGSSDYLFKAFISGFVPFILIALSFIISIFFKVILRRKIRLTRWLIICSLTIMFQLYMNTSSLVLAIYNCMSIEDD